MRVLQKKRINDEIIDTIILVEHPEIVTVGPKAVRDGVVISGEYSQSIVDRGGGITWHGPGQLVLYPIIKWNSEEQSVRGIINKMENLVIKTLEDLGIKGYRDPAMMGVWVDEKKVCSIGLAFLHWVSRHGLALNYATPGQRIENLACCGMDLGVTTSLDKLGYRMNQNGDEITRELIEETILSNIELILKRTPKDPLDWNIGEFI
ncbi:MAG TPA: lipoyl(octanoyl) transferase LipB [Candidatus Thalassarchaeaceae archaeon]|jgi:lipoate-protein ligase B|nr:lipoyl(octanoyl) transferase LipB [Euryarchaeota archaeon]HIH06461.1 lipoyl(octanoyl) transferase LipB [Candidatus Thalassarchaeaceae archaeon]MBT3847445.1 lipoyl(octanoyl) transferase LipB [Euryarchaeota archaeon]MBT4156788.1 lipoyl(octanoyl) transferase LipB [Euryarchaeota archaeon]MBT4180535.1 lipoyl(octanoyl) transferase LipB [Euryarchaeota archaeon]